MSYASEVAADSPLAWWRCDDSGGSSTFADSSGNSHPLNAGGSPTFGGGAAKPFIGGTSVALNGSSQFGEANTAATTWLGSLGDMSIEAWFKTSSSSNMTMLAVDNVGGTPGTTIRKFNFYIASGQVTWMCFTTSTGFPYATSAASTYADGAWHHAVVTRTSTTMLVYIDGSQVGSQTVSNTYTGTNATRLTFGCIDNNGFQNNYFNGSLDEVAVYGSTLSAGRVSAHYQAALVDSGFTGWGQAI